ncbi:MAG: hypothetical protein CVV27_01405 [Candidatus Melainabacteria bacterium HGW-Melainabacteria-1]|nr:MAG: hypothetical protein CVV27_01405 [Candidatus Melainabacteria bacterium HGW-Melainabacteria-1]
MAIQRIGTAPLPPLRPLPQMSNRPHAQNTLKPLDQLHLSSSQPPAANPGWERFLAEARAITKQSLVPDPASLTRRETLPEHQLIALKRTVVLLPPQAGPGLQRAIQDLVSYLERVSGHKVILKSLPISGEPDLSDVPADAAVIAIGAGAAHSLLPASPATPESYSLDTRQYQGRPLVSLNGSDLKGQQYAVYRLMELSGKRFFHYLDNYAPEQGVLPAKGFRENYAPAQNMDVRGFAPHLYHPMPLSDAFHKPSPEHFEMMTKYIDWLVATRQNYLKLELLELDQSNKFLPLKFSDDKFKAWLPYARQIVDYAKSRGVQVSINVAFANYTSANTYAVNPLTAIWQSWRLNGEYKDVSKLKREQTKLTQELQQLPAGEQRRRAQIQTRLTCLQQDLVKQEREYAQMLANYSRDNRKDIQGLIDKLMQVSWDEISWNLGTSEFTPANDDQTIEMMNSAARYLRERYPQVRTVVSSHTPIHPHSEKYDTPYFDLVKHADPGMGLMSHTVQAYSLTDNANVYGSKTFEHKLKVMYETGKDRFDVYYPETSYWLGVDSDLPLFLPVYALNRAHDMAMIRKLPHTDGQMTFTTGFEWGYWLNDYLTGRLQANPEANLTEVLDGAFSIFGTARQDMTRIMIDTMLSQQKMLLDQNLLGFLKGSSWLTDLGHQIKTMPIIKDLFDGTDTTPARLTPESMQKWNLKQIADFEQGDLSKLFALMSSFKSQYERAKALESQIPASAQGYYKELCDGWQINWLRARQAYAGMNASLYARKAELLSQPELKVAGERYLTETRQIVFEAIEVIRRREQSYREPAELNYGKGQGLTLWKNRYLTDLHEGTYWKRTYNEVAKIYHAAELKDIHVNQLSAPAQSSAIGALSFSLAS